MLRTSPSRPGFGVVRRVGPYTELTRPDDLDGVVSAAWRYHAPRDGVVPRHRVLPTAGVVLCVRSRTDRQGRVTDAEVQLFGPVRTVRFFRPEPGTHLEAVEVRPEWSRSLLGVAPEEHLDRVVSALSAVGRHAPDPTRRIGAGGERAASVLDLLDWVRARRREADPEPAARLAVAAVRRMTGGAGVSEAARCLGVSRRHLGRCVLAVAGETPKHLQRIDRLNRAVASADAEDTPRWSALAVAHGYYDQAHLIQDVRDLTGASPTVLHAERRAEAAAPVPFFQDGPEDSARS